MILADPKTHAEWLTARTQGIGGSDAACIVGANPWKSARRLWQEKSGIVTPQDISDKPAVQFGKAAEQHLRALFLLTYPEYSCEYHEFRMYANDRLPFIFATLDGELTDAEHRRGILEIKTTTIQNARQWDEWDDKIPQHYYIQILHQMLACEWAEFVELFAHIRYHKGDEIRAALRKYHIERSDVLPDLEALEEQEIQFYKQWQNGTEPPYILPEI
ncbi:MAG: YqaJ viral recombinase family protein [Oscillospiraceae bacterium]|nr:YqaJ viral recombinase family protein [Oscillospiraceae bacterium]